MSTHLIEELTLNSNENSLLLNLTNLSLDLGYQSAPLPIDFSDLERMVRSRQRQDVTERTDVAPKIDLNKLLGWRPSLSVL